MHGERLDEMPTLGEASLVRLDVAARSLGTCAAHLRALVRAGETAGRQLGGHELVELTSLVALERRLEAAAAPGRVAA